MADLREKLVDVLAEVFCGNWVDYGCDGCRDNRDGMCAAPKFADKLIEHGVTIQRWIPVTERLPKEAHFLVATSDGVVGEAFMESGDFFWQEDCANFDVDWCSITDKVTHWMPLPEAPGK